jgi:hypothetical protein
MSSLQLWSDETVGISVQWNSGGGKLVPFAISNKCLQGKPYSVSVYPDETGFCPMVRWYPTEALAMAYAQRKARQIRRLQK